MCVYIEIEFTCSYLIHVLDGQHIHRMCMAMNIAKYSMDAENHPIFTEIFLSVFMLFEIRNWRDERKKEQTRKKHK